MTSPVTSDTASPAPATPAVDEVDEVDEVEPQIEADDLLEDVSIDGMCGVY